MRGRLLALGLGVILALSLLELGLRAAALVAPRWLGRAAAPASGDGAAIRILAVGDSNTYGTGVERSEAYPARLAARLNEAGGARYEVINLGVPGTNSSQVLEQMPRYLERYRPAMALVMIGVNDYWNPAGTDDASAGIASRAHHVLSHLRVYRLALLAVELARSPARASDGAPVLARRETRADAGGTDDATVWEMRDGNERTTFRNERRTVLLDDDAHAALVRRNLDALCTVVARAGVALAFVAYAADLGHYSVANQALRAAAEDCHVPLVDVRAALVRLRGLPGEAPPLFFPDLHPRAPVYDALAATARDVVLEARAARPAP